MVGLDRNEEEKMSKFGLHIDEEDQLVVFMVPENQYQMPGDLLRKFVQLATDLQLDIYFERYDKEENA